MSSHSPLVTKRFPYLPLTVVVRGHTFALEALLDTGFDGDIVVPTGFLSNDQPPDIYLQWGLADGTVIQVPAYIGSASVANSGPFGCIISELGHESLMRRGISDRLRITLDHGQQMIIEP